MPTLADHFGSSGPGTTATIAGKSWTLIRATKGIQAQWGKWLADRTEEAVMDTAAQYRKRARKLWRDAKRLEDAIEGDAEPEADEKVRLVEEHNDVTAEASLLDLEARKIIERFHDRKGSGEFEYHGNVGIFTAQRGLPGRFQLAWMCLQKHHPGVTMEEVIEAHTNNVDAWGDFLMSSQGVAVKNDDAAPPASTPTQPTATTETGAAAPQ